MRCHPCVSSLLWGLIVIGVWSASVVLGVNPSFWANCSDPRHEALAYQHQLSQQQHEEPAKSIVPSELFRALHGEYCATIRRGAHPALDARFIAVKDSVTKYVEEKERQATLTELEGMLEKVGRAKGTRAELTKVVTHAFGEMEGKKKTTSNVVIIYKLLLHSAGLLLPTIPSMINGTAAVVVANDWCQFVITLESPEERNDRESLLGKLPNDSILLEAIHDRQTKYATARLLKERNDVNMGSGAKLVTGGKAYSMDKLSYSLHEATSFYGLYRNFKMMIFDTPDKTLPNDHRLGDSITFKFPADDDNPAKTAIAQARRTIKKYMEREEDKRQPFARKRTADRITEMEESLKRIRMSSVGEENGNRHRRETHRVRSPQPPPLWGHDRRCEVTIAAVVRRGDSQVVPQVDASPPPSSLRGNSHSHC